MIDCTKGMSINDPHIEQLKLSFRATLFKLLLRLLNRKRLWASIEGLARGIKQVRKEGPARPSKALSQKIKVTVEIISGCEVYIVSPINWDGNESILYVHGGGYVRPITSFHWNFIEWLVQARNAAVVVPMYPLAPESKCLHTLNTLLAIHDFFIHRYGCFQSFMGDSAGAGLCLALCQELKLNRQSMPDKLVLITPFVDATMQNPGIVEIESRDLMLGFSGITEAALLYSGELPVDDPRVSPIYGDLHGLPEMLILIATDDILSLDALIFAEKAQKSSVKIELFMGHKLMHAWPLLPIPEALVARIKIQRFLN